MIMLRLSPILALLVLLPGSICQSYPLMYPSLYSQSWQALRIQAVPETFNNITDSATGVQLSLPAGVSGPKREVWGNNWTSLDGSLEIATIKYRKSLETFYNEILIGHRGEDINLKTLSSSGFVVQGRDKTGTFFHVQVAAGAGEIRGVSVKWTRKDLLPVVTAIVRSLTPFPASSEDPLCPSVTYCCTDYTNENYITDSATGVQLSLPARISGPKREVWGHNWINLDGSLEIATIRYQKSLRTFYNEIIYHHKGEYICLNTFSGSKFIVQGKDKTGAFFHVQAVAGAGEIRGFSVKWTRTDLLHIVNSTVLSFQPFPIPSQDQLFPPVESE